MTDDARRAEPAAEAEVDELRGRWLRLLRLLAQEVARRLANKANAGGPAER